MHKRLLLALLIITLVFTSGCWSRKELNQIAIVLGVGVDQGKGGRVRVTVQIVNTGQVKAAQSGAQGGGSQAKPALVLSSQGKTMFDAVRNFISQSARKLFFSHNEVIIFGEELARNGIAPVLDFLERDPEPRPRVWVLVAKGEAKDILELQGKLETTSAMGISNSMKASLFLGKAGQVMYGEFLQKYSNKVNSVVAPRIEIIEINGEKHFRISGMAVFKRDKLAGWLSESETRGLLWVLGEVKSGIVVVQAPGVEQEKVSLEIIRAKSKIKPEFREGRPVVTVEVQEEANIGEITGPVDVSPPEKVKALEKGQADAIAKEIKAAVATAQRLNTDIFGFGEAFHRKFPREWAAMKDRWEEEFPELQVEITVKTKIRRIGEKVRPVAPK